MRNTWPLCLVLMIARAFANPAHDRADALFLLGKELMSQDKLPEACAAFESSNRLEPNTSTLLNHANCREKNGQLATAWRLFTEAEWKTLTQSDAGSNRLNKVARERANLLEARLSKLSIEVPPAHRIDGLEIVRGKERIELGDWEHLIPIDGGTYPITVRAPGYLDWSITVVIKPEGDTLTVIIPQLDPIGEVEPAWVPNPTGQATDRAMQSRAPTVNSTPSQPVTPRQDAARYSLMLPIVTGSAALLLSGAAFAFSRWGDSIYADSKQEPNDAKQEALWQSANGRRHAAIGFAAGAAGCLGAAAYLYLRSGREAAQPVARRSLRIEPAATASSLGFGVSGAW